ncbi:P-loop containing nucleoside triphosphate hydrolase protein [Suhomyces tanzawaensis NRRL Y-17324]|uniref:p-loop containing nucleoside triphosphate hydrolase protein n=1 Tax=Suhomyces tanzawaensis NRRL Y-17324 TaxID=984487 RepID=A0A1E4SHY5_9ASCO|nr:P-loop containing nucleoside triphosphate hydrolase protein [Suhomyces tanzawaensis NRRL Y-17324]ODV79090.1 P-loop containing nucleoside triphosphate hydrolase protein [Suhomyces tanzawaensis NRRL Y-17324]
MTESIDANNIDALVLRVLTLYEQVAPRRLIISLAGTPGSGKTSLSTNIVNAVSKTVKALVVLQDGFHLYRAQLLELADPAEAVRRRGAPFTFNATGFLELVKQIRSQLTEPILAPTFDHALKDPLENDLTIEPDVGIVILEGNYLSLKDDVWTEISNYVDETWICKAPLDLVHQRLVKRHLESGIAANQQEAEERAGGSDFDNAKYILEHSKKVDLEIYTG